MTARPEVRSTAVEKQEPKAALLKHRLERMQGSLIAVLGNADQATRQATLTMLYFAKRPELQNCDVESIAQSVMQIAQWNLEVGRTAHIVAFGSTATPIRDWRGDIVMAKRAKEITSCRPVIIREADDFEIEQGIQPTIRHKPDWQNGGKPIGAYAVVTLPDGSTDFEVMNLKQIEAVRGRSRAKNNGPWVSDWEEMAKKTVVKRLLKRYPGAEVEDDEDEAPIPLAVAQPVVRSRAVPAVEGRTEALALSAGSENGESGEGEDA